MDDMPAKKMRKEDHTQYTDSNREEISFLQDRVAGYFKKGVDFFKKLVTCEMEANFASVARPNTFYNRPQKYRPVPRQPHPPELLVELERVRKGFDPLHMTVSRYQKEEKEMLMARREIVKEAKLRRNSENEAPVEPTQPRKIFKKVMSFEEEEENREEKWELCEKKFRLVLDTLQEIGEAAEKKPNQASFFATAKAQKEEKPQTNTSNSKPQALFSNQSTPLPTIPEDSVENTSDQSTLQADKTEQTNVPNFQNYAFLSSTTKTIGMQEFISKNSQTSSDVSILFGFGSNDQNPNLSQQQTFSPSVQQTSNMNSPIQFNTSSQPEPQYNNQQSPPFFNPGKPNYSTSVHFPPQSQQRPVTNNQFANGIINSKLSNANPADFFGSPNPNNNNTNNSRLFDTTSNRTQKKDKGYRHKKGTELRIQ